MVKPIYNSLDGGDNFKAHLAQRDWTIALCLCIERTDGNKYGFTDHDNDIVYEDNASWISPENDSVVGVTYKAAYGQVPSEIASSNDLSVDNLSINGIFDLNGISRADMLTGRFDHAEVKLFIINWNDHNMGILPLPGCGYLGEVIFRDQQFTAELRGLVQALQQPYGGLFTRSCRATLGDSLCQVDLSGFTSTGTVTAVTDDKEFTATLSGNTPAGGSETGWYTHGLITWTAGDNDDLQREVKNQTYSGGSYTFELWQEMEYDIDVGDTFTVYAGCNKSKTHCQNKFDNWNNFRGFPYIPGSNKIKQIGTDAPSSGE